MDFTDDISTYHFRPLYNEEDYLCAYGQLYASEAAGITGEEFIPANYTLVKVYEGKCEWDGKGD